MCFQSSGLQEVSLDHINSFKEKNMKGTLFMIIVLVLNVIFMSCNGRNNTQESQPNWILGKGNFIQQGFTPQAGDQVWVRVFDKSGKELVSEKYGLNDSNLDTWREDITSLLNSGENGKYIQVRNDPNEKLFSKTNYIWLTDPNHVYVMGLSD